jgi:hypothetical protein
MGTDRYTILLTLTFNHVRDLCMHALTAGACVQARKGAVSGQALKRFDKLASINTAKGKAEPLDNLKRSRSFISSNVRFETPCAYWCIALTTNATVLPACPGTAAYGLRS